LALTPCAERVPIASDCLRRPPSVPFANELVEWFNQVEATYRGELRELNELNFARFDAKLEQRSAERLSLRTPPQRPSFCSSGPSH